MADLTTGANAEGYEAFCEDIYNWLKNSWRQSDPCSLSGLTAGMVVNDSDDDRLYLALLISGCTCSEILQSCIPLSDDVAHGYGDDFNVSIYYDELVLDELMIEAADRADTEGVTIGLLEANQAFRVRGAADALALEVYPNDTQGCLINIYSGSWYSSIQQSTADSLSGGGADLRIGLDESSRMLIILDRGDIERDLGLSPADYPSIYVFDADYDSYFSLGWETDDVPYFTAGGNAVKIRFGVEQQVPMTLSDISDPPTDAELDALFGLPATVGVGWWTFLYDITTGGPVYLIVSDGLTGWWYEQLTQAL